MNLSAILTEKKKKGADIRKEFGLAQTLKPLGLIQLQDENLTQELINGLKILSVGFVVYIKGHTPSKVGNNVIITGNIDEHLLEGFDFVVSDDNLQNISQYSQYGVTPILVKENHLGNILKEFNPMKNEGNAFLYDSACQWSIFYTIVRYMENYKFPFDNKNLVKNVLSI